jgi:hypothetical protein
MRLANLLIGNVPYEIGNLGSPLVSLPLKEHTWWCNSSEHNIFDNLSYLNLSYNNLSGRIPSGHQLDSLKIDDPAFMYTLAIRVFVGIQFQGNILVLPEIHQLS